MNLLSDTGIELGNFNLQDECDFQAAELAGLAEVFLNLSSTSSGNWSHQFCEYLATMILEVCHIPFLRYRIILYVAYQSKIYFRNFITNISSRHDRDL